MKISALAILALFLSCSSESKFTPLIPKDMTSEAEKKNKLFAFVGRKISVTDTLREVKPSQLMMDAEYHAKYEILERVYGYYPKDTIEFEVYDHYGTPIFSLYENVLLFVSEFEGKYYHEKYQFFAVYRTKNKRWAGIYSEYYDYENVKPEKIAFQDNVVLPRKLINLDNEVVYPDYPELYFRIIGENVYPLYGNYVQDLFAIKKHGVLKWRGLFGRGNENWEDSLFNVEDTKLAPITDSL